MNNKNITKVLTRCKKLALFTPVIPDVRRKEIHMKAWIAKTFANENGPMAQEGKSIIIQGSKEEIKSISDFMNEVVKYLESNDYCHMHLCDYMKNWRKKEHIDIEVNVEKQSG